MRLRFLLLLTLSATVSAQEPDTTDWHSYYPLEVGNEWHRHIRFPLGEPDFLHKLVIRRDTVISDTTLFVLSWCSDNTWDPEPCIGSEHLVRYDEENAIVVERFAVGNGYIEYHPFDALCRLDLPFDPQNPQDACFDLGFEVYVDGEYGATRSIGMDTATGTLKSFDTIAGGGSYLSGIGWISAWGDGNPNISTLEYARISGVEYGTPIVSNEPDAPRLQSVVRTYPNPARHEVTLLFSIPTAQQVEASVYDLRGVLLETRSLGLTASGVEVSHTLDVSKWPSGLYQIRLTGDRGFSATKGIIVIH